MTAAPHARIGPRGGRVVSSLALGAVTAVYALFATAVMVRALSAPPGPAWERLLVGLARSSAGELALLVASGAAVAGSLWRIREREESAASAPSTSPSAEE